MKYVRKVAITTLFGLMVLPGLAQTEGNPTGEFIYNGWHYVPHRPWVTVGYGYGYSFSEQCYEPHFMLDAHFRVQQKHYLGAGFVTSRNQFLDHDTEAILLPHQYVKHSVNSLHVMYGWRYEHLMHNVACFAGPAYNWGYQSAFTDSAGNHYVYPYNELGLYASLQYTRKVYYDIGLGISMFGAVSQSYQVAGLTLHVYLSSAYKRTVK